MEIKDQRSPNLHGNEVVGRVAGGVDRCEASPDLSLEHDLYFLHKYRNLTMYSGLFTSIGLGSPA